MSKITSPSRFSRREFLKLGGGVLAAAAATRLGSKSVKTEVVHAADLPQAVTPNIHMVGTDVWIHLPGQVPIPNTNGQFYNPDNLAPGFDPADPSAGLTTYMFGFRNVTGLTEAQIVDQKMKCQATAPLFWVHEGEDYFIRLGNLGLQMRPDLVDAHTLHWHGFRNAWPIFDGEPHSSIAVPIGRNITMYYKPVDPGTYMYHCHFEETEHVHMGMTGSVFVVPAQYGTPIGGFTKFAYNDGDGSTGFDREYVIILTDVWAEAHWDDAHIQLPDWTDFRAEYFLMNGRVYPDTLEGPGQGNDPSTGDLIGPTGRPDLRYQPYSALIKANAGERVLLRLINLTFGQQTLTLPGLKMNVVGKDATLLRGRDGTDLYYDTNTVYFGSGQTVDVIVTMPDNVPGPGPTKYLFYNRNYERLANANDPGFGGQMTELRVYPAGTLPAQTTPNT
jgi:FtsP/CotA-like multicopper oxidase with cupredoxin domain